MLAKNVLSLFAKPVMKNTIRKINALIVGLWDRLKGLKRECIMKSNNLLSDAQIQDVKRNSMEIKVLSILKIASMLLLL